MRGCRLSALKCLRIGQMYYLCNDYTITEDGISMRDEYVKPLPEDFFSLDNRSSLEINISAVVGMNGDGKSTLIELMMRLINNCAKHYRLTDKDNLLRVEGIKAELYYQLDDEVFCIRETEADTYTSLLRFADLSNHNARHWKGVMKPVQSVSRMKELFYTIVSNYSLYAYDTKDFRDEWSDKVQTTEECWKCWLHYLFHKNDGYRTPMTLHPYRYEGNIDVNKETDLTMQRLMALYIQEDSPRASEHSFRRIGDKDAEKDAEILQLTDLGYSKLQQHSIVKYFKDVKSQSSLDGLVKKIRENVKKYDDKVEEDLHNDDIEAVEMSLDLLMGVDNADYQQFLRQFLQWDSKERSMYSSRSDVRQLLSALLEAKNNNGDDLRYDELAPKYKKYDRLNVLQLARLRFIYGVMKSWKYPSEILLKKYEELTDVERCQHYIVYKTIDICGTYPEYRDYLNERDGGWNGNGLIVKVSDIADVVSRIKDDTTHVTLKLRQCRNFIEQLELDEENVFESLDGKGLPAHIREVYEGSLLVKFDELKVHYQRQNAFPLDLLPPPIYKAEIFYQSVRDTDSYIPYRFLSSGEKQLLNNFGALLYHLRNLDSVIDDGRRYENVNIILEEIELYFHPEYQRKVVKLLIEKLTAAIFQHIKRVNITFVTHSPFILSDIPLCNVLFLKGGSPAVEMMQENTFGANIHGMLKNGFFLPSLPIGEFAHEKINVLFERLNGYKLDARSEEQAEWFYSNIMRVGEPYLREQLMRLYNMHYPVRDYD